MAYRPPVDLDYVICDVFTDQRFGGNQLAVIPDAADLTTTQMQQIAREFNFSESTFVLPAEKGHTARVRIFTPGSEVPFAGHPNVGTAFALATTGRIEAAFDGDTEIIFEQEAGLVPITIRCTSGSVVSCELSAPEPVSLGASVGAEVAAAALGLDADDVVTMTHPPQVASVGLPFLMVELRSLDSLGRARAVNDRLAELRGQGLPPYVHLYVRMPPGESVDLQARMFAPLDGVAEDPATGSANCALAGMLAQLDERSNGDFEWTIAQGIEMGRPSLLRARANKRDAGVAHTWIGGSSVLVATGTLYT